MINIESRLKNIRTLRSQVDVMYQSMVAPVQLQGKRTADIVIKMAYEQMGREEFAARFKRIIDGLDKQERDILLQVEA